MLDFSNEGLKGGFGGPYVKDAAADSDSGSVPAHPLNGQGARS